MKFASLCGRFESTEANVVGQERVSTFLETGQDYRLHEISIVDFVSE